MQCSLSVQGWSQLASVTCALQLRWLSFCLRIPRRLHILRCCLLLTFAGLVGSITGLQVCFLLLVYVAATDRIVGMHLDSGSLTTY